MTCDKHRQAREWLVRYGLASPESTDAEVERLTWEVGQRITAAVEDFANQLREIFKTVQPAIEQFVGALVEIHGQVTRSTVQVGDEELNAEIHLDDDPKGGDMEGTGI